MHQKTLTKNRNRVNPARKENWKNQASKKSFLFPFLKLKCVISALLASPNKIYINNDCF